jgi:hypothetical protein
MTIITRDSSNSPPLRRAIVVRSLGERRSDAASGPSP